jgi:hypothetical protein
VDLVVLRAVSEQAPSDLGGMDHPQDISNTLWAIAQSAEMDMAALRAVSEQARRVAGEMKPQNISNTLCAIVGRHEGAQHQEHKSSGRHVPEKGIIP